MVMPVAITTLNRSALVFFALVHLGCSDPLPSSVDASVTDKAIDDSVTVGDSNGGLKDLPPLPDGLDPCTSTGPALPNHLEGCAIRHLPEFSFYLSAKQPKTIETVTLRVHTKPDDAQQVVLRYWDGVEHQSVMTRSAADDYGDIYSIEVSATARPTYYRFIITDGSATATVNRTGIVVDTPLAKDDFFVSPLLSAKTIRYNTTFKSPEIRVASGSGYTSHALTHESGERYGVEGVGGVGQLLSFHFRDAQSGAEDHPPGGGDYYVDADQTEAWVHKGTVFDVAPESLDLGPIDVHTHPYNKVNGQLVLDSGPMLALLPAQGTKAAVTMIPGSLQSQQSQMEAVHQANRWIVPLVWVEPKSHSAAQVEALLQGGVFRGLKFHPTISEYPADGALMDPFLALAEKYRLPVSIHSATDDNAKPARIVALAQRHPKVSIIMFHTELGAVDKSPAIALIKDFPNIYAETSWTNHESILAAFAALDSSRTLFGTDATVDGYDHFTKTSIANPQGEYVYTIPHVISELQKEAHPDAYSNWAYLNAIRLYRWRFRADADLHDTDGDRLADVDDTDDDNDGIADGQDDAPLDPAGT